MLDLDILTNLFAQSATLIWHPWQGGVVAGCFLTALAGVAVELKDRLFEDRRIDLSRRSRGALAWQQSGTICPRGTAEDLAPTPESESRQGWGWCLEARSRQRPSRNSDFFDTVELDSDHLAFYLGEVSGGGVAAALYQASCKALLRYAAFTPDRAASAVEEVNSILCQREPDGRFVTLLYGVLQLSTGEVTMVSAGQIDPLLQRVDGTSRRMIMPLRLPLGMTDKPDYEAVSFRLNPGDRLLLVSDGITQARDRSREPLSHERLRVFIHKHRNHNLAQWADAVLETINRYDDRITDDRTLVALGYFGPQGRTSIARETVLTSF